MTNVMTDNTNWRSRTIALVLDDHKIFTSSFCTLLEQTRLFQFVYGFSSEEDLRNFLLEKKLNTTTYFFLDYYLQDQVALTLINDLKRMYDKIHIVILSSLTNPILIQNILGYRIDGFLSKYSESAEIVACIQSIKANSIYISPYIQDIIGAYNHINAIPFSAREIEILKLFALGLTVNATAEKLILSRHTIVSHRRRMMAKTNSKTISELLAFARKIELI